MQQDEEGTLRDPLRKNSHCAFLKRWQSDEKKSREVQIKPREDWDVLGSISWVHYNLTDLIQSEEVCLWR